MGSPYYVPGIGYDGMPVGVGQPIGMQQQQGYVYMPDPNAPVKDTFEKTQEPEKKERLLAKLFKNNSFFGALGNSVANLVTGPVNFVKSMFYSEKEGFFRAVKTLGMLVVGGAAVAAGMAFAPLLTGAALTGLTLFGAGAAAVKMGRHGLGWLGNMVQGKYDKAVEHAHDFSESTTEGVLSAVGARQTTSMLMRNLGQTVGKNSNWWNLGQTWKDINNSIFNRGFFRNAKNELVTNIQNFKSEARIAAYGENTDVARAFRALQNERGRLKVQLRQKLDKDGKPLFNKDGSKQMVEEWVDSNIAKDSNLLNNYNPNDIRFHKAIQQGDGKVRILVEQRIPETDANGLRLADRVSNSVFHEIVIGKKNQNLTRLVRTVEYKDGLPSEVVRPVEFASGVETMGSAPGMRSDWAIGRGWENIATKSKTLKESAWDIMTLKGIRQRIFGKGYKDYVDNQAKADTLKQVSVKFENGKATYSRDGEFLDLSVNTVRGGKSEFDVLRHMTDSEIQPTTFDKASGIVRAIFNNWGQGKNAAITQYNLSNGGLNKRTVSDANETILMAHAEKMLGRNISANRQVLKMNEETIMSTATGAARNTPVAKEITYAVVEQIGKNTRTHLLRYRMPHDLYERMMANNTLEVYLRNALLKHETATNDLAATTSAPGRFSGQWWKRMWNDLSGRTEADRPIVDILTNDSRILGRSLPSVGTLPGSNEAAIQRALNNMQVARQNNAKVFGLSSNLVGTVTAPVVAIPAIGSLPRTLSSFGPDHGNDEDKKEESKSQNTSSTTSYNNVYPQLPAYGLMNRMNPFNQCGNDYMGDPSRALA